MAIHVVNTNNAIRALSISGVHLVLNGVGPRATPPRPKAIIWASRGALWNLSKSKPYRTSFRNVSIL